MQEIHMLTEESDLSDRNVRSLSPEEWDELRREAIRRAHRARTELFLELLRKFSGALRAGLLMPVQGALAALERWRANRQDRAAIARLHALDDGALRDIGIRRSEIESIVHAHGNDTTRTRSDERLAA
jgi:uncharacterized protein YjiS (DUF1127 family)